jgi:catechol 2,3-dioxygenase-like lactoylglutathione lyase family enzyme
MLETLDHAVIAVRDLGAATRDLVGLLGRGPSWSGEHPGAGTANVLFRLERSYVELLAPAGPGPLAAAVEGRLEAAGEGLFALAFGTPDAEACRADFAARGLEPGPATDGLGRDLGSGAFRRWRTVTLPPERTRGVLLFAIEHRSPPGLLPEVEPACAPNAAPHAIDHVVVRSADVGATRALLRDGLGLRLALERRFDAFDLHALFFRVGGVTIEVAGSLAPPAQPGAHDSLWGLAWAVRDAAAARARLAGAGYDVSPVRAGRKPGTSVCTVRSRTCGVATLLVGPAAEPA